MLRKSLVSGANGHLGNNLVRLLLQKGLPVRASVRDVSKTRPFVGLDCERVPADITDKTSLIRAMEGIDTCYAVGAAFKLWAKDPVREIYDVNLNGTRNVLEAAAEAGVRRVVYVSSVAALDYSRTPVNEDAGYNTDRRDMYYNSKNDGEKLAFDLARDLGIELVAVLPAAMIGGEAFAPLNVSSNVLKLILNGEIPVDTGITLNWVDVRDVAEACYQAAERGQNGARYILSNETCLTITETTRLAQQFYPDLGLRVPRSVPKPVLYGIAGLMEWTARLRGRAPLLTRKDISMFSGLRQDFDIRRAREELGFTPRPATEALREAFDYLRTHPELLR